MLKKQKKLIALFLSTILILSMVNIRASSASSSVDIPSNLSYNITETTITVTWDEISNATNYEVEVNGSMMENGLSTEFIHEDVIIGSSYTYRVRAKTHEGTGEWSEALVVEVEEVINEEIMIGIPQNIVTETLEDSVVISWDIVADAVGYEVEIDGTTIESVNEAQYILANPELGIAYTLRIRAKNENVTGEWSEALIVEVEEVINEEIVIGIPQNIITETLENSVRISWDVVVDAVGYEVEIDGTTIESVNEAQYILANPELGIAYTLRIRAKNENVTGDWSEALVVEVEEIVIGIPQNIMTETLENSVRISWDVVADAVGYEVEIDGTTIESINEAEYILSNPEVGVAYTLRIRAKNENVTGDWSEALVVEVEEIVIGIPQNIVTEKLEDSVVISWDVVVDVVGYEVEIDGTTIESVNEAQYILANPELGIAYTLRIRAKNENVTGEWSEALIVQVEEVINEEIVIGIPQNIITETLENSVRISWDVVEGAEGYDIEVNESAIESVSQTEFIHWSRDWS
ncbi:fibronectin type III domain-containing protein [Alkaliphilus serpentinus]|uniref:Fibronectin type III domain-containing protein n=1 Tax=Alkaliphilus serpentinus TaxID=1482731 RepID=A0A833HP26_9FIRM|nr:fibronectin type III domain-containing protein [Alkaliphilus serpentinus]KAB3530219.1 fibronectin type III domain-containing protein [Alkaliphilus serpentinus]